jgi:hypothetical protein
MKMEIQLIDVLPIENAEEYKLHLGGINEDGEHPLDLYLEDKQSWIGWNQWRGPKNEWNRDYIFSLIEFYPKSNAWLFGGIFKVMERKPHSYVLEVQKKYEMYIGRLIINFYRYQGLRGRAFRLERYIQDMKVNQILEYEYTGEVFPGFENINHDFRILEPIFTTEKGDWKTALENVKGVYIITDRSNGKAYIGSAYGAYGIWSRWATYIGTLHGGNDELASLIERKGKRYVRDNFIFSLLEVNGMHVPDEVILSRESYWKDKLLTRQHGYNAN